MKKKTLLPAGSGLPKKVGNGSPKKVVPSDVAGDVFKTVDRWRRVHEALSQLEALSEEDSMLVTFTWGSAKGDQTVAIKAVKDSVESDGLFAAAIECLRREWSVLHRDTCISLNRMAETSEPPATDRDD